MATANVFSLLEIRLSHLMNTTMEEDMMTREKGRIFLILGLCAAIVVGSAVTSRAQEPVKIGYVDLRVALNEAEAGKKAKTELESIIKTKQAAIDEKGKNIEKQKADLEKQASVLSPEARKAKEEEVERQVREYQRLVQDSQAEIKKKEEQHTGGILKELRQIIEKIGQEEGYSLILENVEGIILYSKKDLDITDRVIKRHNESRGQQKTGK